MKSKRAAFVFFITAHVVLQITTVCCEKRTSQFSFKQIQRAWDLSIIQKNMSVESLIQCTSVCAEDETTRSLYFHVESNTCRCNNNIDTNTDVPTAMNITYGEKILPSPQGEDCLDLYQGNSNLTDGVYTIHPLGGNAVTTWCDMTNGGWTVIQRRFNGSENFLTNWTHYVSGFGNKESEYWLGLDNINLLTKKPSELSISMEPFSSESYPPLEGPRTEVIALYRSFSIGDTHAKYNLSISGFKGTCDGLTNHTGSPFSTYDNKTHTTFCNSEVVGGWWYKSCDSNLNGEYLNGHDYGYATGIHWTPCWGKHYSLEKTLMKIRRTSAEEPSG